MRVEECERGGGKNAKRGEEQCQAEIAESANAACVTFLT